jgi:hypothetical protein
MLNLVTAWFGVHLSLLQVPSGFPRHHPGARLSHPQQRGKAKRAARPHASLAQTRLRLGQPRARVEEEGCNKLRCASTGQARSEALVAGD